MRDEEMSFGAQPRKLWASRRSTLEVYDDARCCAGITGGAWVVVVVVD